MFSSTAPSSSTAAVMPWLASDATARSGITLQQLNSRSKKGLFLPRHKNIFEIITPHHDSDCIFILHENNFSPCAHADTQPIQAKLLADQIKAKGKTDVALYYSNSGGKLPIAKVISLINYITHIGLVITTAVIEGRTRNIDKFITSLITTQLQRLLLNNTIGDMPVTTLSNWLMQHPNKSNFSFYYDTTLVSDSRDWIDHLSQNNINCIPITPSHINYTKRKSISSPATSQMGTELEALESTVISQSDTPEDSLVTASKIAAGLRKYTSINKTAVLPETITLLCNTIIPLLDKWETAQANDINHFFDLPLLPPSPYSDPLEITSWLETPAELSLPAYEVDLAASRNHISALKQKALSAQESFENTLVYTLCDMIESYVSKLTKLQAPQKAIRRGSLTFFEPEGMPDEKELNQDGDKLGPGIPQSPKNSS